MASRERKRPEYFGRTPVAYAPGSPSRYRLLGRALDGVFSYAAGGMMFSRYLQAVLTERFPEQRPRPAGLAAGQRLTAGSARGAVYRSAGGWCATGAHSPFTSYCAHLWSCTHMVTGSWFGPNHPMLITAPRIAFLLASLFFPA
jgi:hypothetical protein